MSANTIHTAKTEDWTEIDRKLVTSRRIMMMTAPILMGLGSLSTFTCQVGPECVLDDNPVTKSLLEPTGRINRMVRVAIAIGFFQWAQVFFQHITNIKKHEKNAFFNVF